MRAAGLASGLLFIAAIGAAQPEQPELLAQEELIRFSAEGVAEYRVTYYDRLPYYKGRLPLRYVTGKRQFGSMPRIVMTHWHDYGGFRSTFSPRTPAKIPGIGVEIPGSARTVGRKGELLAEAHVIGVTPGEGFEIRETHYGANGRTALFTCRSFFGFDGIKIRETETTGKKRAGDFYFLWPAGR